MRIHKFLTGSLYVSILMIQTQSATAELTISEASIPDIYSLDGTVEAINSGTISAQTSGTILAINGDVGDSVDDGQVLIQIDNTQQKAAVAQASASLAQAEALNDDSQTLLKRNARLLKQGTLSQGEYDRSEAQAKSAAANVEVAKAALQQAKTQLSYTEVTAPYAGLIMERFVEVGELVNPGTPLMSGYGTGAMRAITDVPQRIASKFNDASQVSVEIEHKMTPATKVTLYPFADNQRHSVRLRAALSDEASANLLPGQWVKVHIQAGARNAILIPSSALLRRGEMNAVYVQENDRSYLRQIRLGNPIQRNGDTWYEVLAGLQAGEVIHEDALSELGRISQTTSSDKE